MSKSKHTSFHVDVLAIGQYLIISPSALKGPGFYPTDDQSRVGCVVTNSAKTLRVSRDALKLMGTIKRNQDAIGDIDWWACTNGTKAFSWWGAIHRVIHVPTCEAARGFAIHEKDCTIIPNRPTAEMRRNYLKYKKQSMWKEPFCIEIPVPKPTDEDIKVTHFQVAAWGHAEIHFHGPPEKLAVLEKWVKDLIPAKHGTIAKPGINPEYDRHHLTASLQLPAWVFLCNWWTKYSVPTMGEIWQLKEHAEKAQYTAPTTPAEYSRCLLIMAHCNLERETQGTKVLPQVAECIAFMKAKVLEIPVKKAR